MIRLMKADLYRLSRTKSVYIALLILAVMFLTSILTGKVSSIRVVIENGNSTLPHENLDFISSLQYFTLNASFLIWGYIIYFIQVFSKEFGNRTFKNILMAGMSRTKYIYSKLLTLLILVFSTTIFYYLMNAVVAYFYYEDSSSIPTVFLSSTAVFIVGLTLCIMVYFIIASLLQVLFNSTVAATLFIGLGPVVVQVVEIMQGWGWLKYVNYLSITQAFGLGLIKGKELLPYIYVNGTIVVIVMLLNIWLLKKKEF
ncbi:ABC transporter permease [Bacillus paramycoides]|uniref:ABC transporter permease n=1 Tax=Bacillus paramycoides TaxID=2026194 RepID=A0ABU6N2L9_9BACI|nr:ABC transporter permease [Bacillus paramycoides]